VKAIGNFGPGAPKTSACSSNAICVSVAKIRSRLPELASGVRRPGTAANKRCSADESGHRTDDVERVGGKGGAVTFLARTKHFDVVQVSANILYEKYYLK
jgi:hypothetical protein